MCLSVHSEVVSFLKVSRKTVINLIPRHGPPEVMEKCDIYECLGVANLWGFGFDPEVFCKEKKEKDRCSNFKP